LRSLKGGETVAAVSRVKPEFGGNDHEMARITVWEAPSLPHVPYAARYSSYPEPLPDAAMAPATPPRAQRRRRRGGARTEPPVGALSAANSKSQRLAGTHGSSGRSVRGMYAPGSGRTACRECGAV